MSRLLHSEVQERQRELMKIIVAIDSFKGCLTSAEANNAAAEGIAAAVPDADIVQIPVSDGGEGWVDAIQNAIVGERIEVLVRDPLMRPVMAEYLVRGDTAVVEIAKSSGLTLLSPEELNPMVASSYGVGQVVADAVKRGCRHIIVGLGGSAVSDCGIGMLCALRECFAGGGSWKDICVLRDVRFTIATDVRNPLCGINGAAYVFAPGKGATGGMVRVLDVRARRFADESAEYFGYDRRDVPGAGAAGGLGYAFLEYMDAECRSGIEFMLDAVDFGGMVRDAAMVITGEGQSDCQTLMGKLPYGILQRCRLRGVPVVLAAGRVRERRRLLAAGFADVVCINPPGVLDEDCMKPEKARGNIRRALRCYFQSLRL